MNRIERYSIQMSELEMEMVNEVSQHHDLSDLVRSYIKKLHKDIILYKNIGETVDNENRYNSLW